MLLQLKKTVSGLVKIVYPNGEFEKEDIREILEIALELRRRVKEQLKKIGGMEFFDVNFSYLDLLQDRTEYVTLPEQGASSLIPEGNLKPGHLFTVGPSVNGKLGIYKLETEMLSGGGKFSAAGIGSKKEVKESVTMAEKYFKSNYQNISNQINCTDNDYVMQVKDLRGVGLTDQLTLASFIAYCSVALSRQILSSTAILGNFSIGGTVEKVQNLADVFQLCLDSGAKKLVLPMSAASDLALVPPELRGKFSLIFYDSPEDAVFKALGIE